MLQNKYVLGFACLDGSGFCAFLKSTRASGGDRSPYVYRDVGFIPVADYDPRSR